MLRLSRVKMRLYSLHIFLCRFASRSPIAVQSITPSSRSSIDLGRLLIFHHEDEAGVTKKVAFKFNVLYKALRLRMAWDELHLLKSLPPHPNTLPLIAIQASHSSQRPSKIASKFFLPSSSFHRSVAPLSRCAGSVYSA
ncbi:uncharacterized protein BDV17DRAFT_277130 [Aspergillus undulatus]|uniref:uncharacterized protein n=1 Tax=Aspergillus undulatus TaxID=1810928 RepID=UPI003CCE2987